MKRIIYLLSVVLILFVFASCSFSKQSSGKNIESSTGSKVEQGEKDKVHEDKKESILLYFGNSDADLLIPEKREVSIDDNSSIEKTIIEELMKGSANSELISPIPEGTKILSVKTEDGTCTVDFSKEFVENHPGGSAGESITINAIVNSLTELQDIKNVKFLIEGSQRESYIHLAFDQPFVRNESMIQK